MKTRVVCEDVRLETQDDKACLVLVASKDAPEGKRKIDLTNPTTFEGIKAALKAQGITLGEPVPSGVKSNVVSSQPMPLRIIVRDDGVEKQLIAHTVEEYSLSSGSTLYFLYIHETSGDYHWLIGRPLELIEL